MTEQLPNHTSPLSALKPFARVALIAVDIDGTLSTAKDQDVIHLVKLAVRSLGHYGVEVIVATGRAMAGAQATVFGLNQRMGPAIVYNGAVIVDTGKQRLLSRQTIDESHVVRVRALALEHGVRMWAYNCEAPTMQSWATSDQDHVLEAVRGYSGSPGPSKEINGISVQWNAPESDTSEAVAILLSRANGELSALLPKLYGMDGISITSSTPDYVEIRPEGVSKATALSMLARNRGISRSRILTIGDNHNDVEMLKWAGTSVAVANATDTATNSANYRASQSDAQGVLETLRLVINAKRFARGAALDGPSPD